MQTPNKSLRSDYNYFQSYYYGYCVLCRSHDNEQKEKHHQGQIYNQKIISYVKMELEGSFFGLKNAKKSTS